MQVGKLDHKITIQSFTASTDVYGQPFNTWANLASVWASVDYNGGSEAEKDGAIIASSQVLFVVRHSNAVKGINTAHRIYFDSDYYDITRIQHEGRNRYIHIYAVKKEGKE